MNRNALIFGAGGQDGHYLTKHLQEQGIEITGVSRKGDFLIGDVGDYTFVQNLIKTLKPTYIFHLAADSTTSHDAWLANHNTICNGSLYILEAVKIFSPGSKVFLSGSGLQFINRDLPIKESDPFEASSQYSVSRIQSVYAARYYRSLGIQTYVGYFFNHDSPLRSERHMTMKIATASMRISKGSKEKIVVGDIHAKKEWGYAGDIAKGITTLVQQNDISEAVVGTGVAHSLKEWVDICFENIGKDPALFLESNNNYVSPYKVLVSDPSTIFSLGWKPSTDLKALAKLILPAASLKL